MLVIVEGRFIHRIKIFWGCLKTLTKQSGLGIILSCMYIWHACTKIRSPYRFNENINFVQVDAHGSS